jgi:hypothetical protein
VRTVDSHVAAVLGKLGAAKYGAGPLPAQLICVLTPRIGSRSR